MLLQDDASVIACDEFTPKSLPSPVAFILSLRAKREQRDPSSAGLVGGGCAGDCLVPC